MSINLIVNRLKQPVIKLVASIKSFYINRRFQLGGAILGVCILMMSAVLAINGSAPHYSEQSTKDDNSIKPESNYNPQTQKQSKTTSSSVTSNITSSASSTSGSPGIHSEVNINGQSIEVPKNGSVHRVISEDNGNQSSVTVNNSSSSQTSTSGTSSSFTNTNSYSHSIITVTGDSR